MPWIQVSAYRATIGECNGWNSTSLTHGVCASSIPDQYWDMSDFDGVPYTDIGSPNVQLKGLTFSQAGNRKPLQIAKLNEESGEMEIIWAE